MQSKQDVINWIEFNREQFIALADAIWEKPEISMKEFFASKLQADYLEYKDFTIKWDLGGLNTAFVAEWGSGKPVIGFLGEYDALSNLSQSRNPFPDPLIPGEPGQGCGHNLLGVGGLAAAAAVKEWLKATGSTGTVRYYGCPGEENGDGKVFMARAGAFDDLDAAFNFHPSSINSASKGSTVGVKDVIFRFHGISSHAGSEPDLGRSALDAVELMNIGVNYLREHVTDKVRIHYTITHGGDLPNIVPSKAEVWYFIRAHKPEELEEVSERIFKIARGAAMMTETRLELIIQGGCSSVLSNHTLADLQYEAMQVVGPIRFTAEEYEFARKIRGHFSQKDLDESLQKYFLPKYPQPYETLKDKSLAAENYPAMDEGEIGTGSTDVGDVSQITPLSMLDTTCEPLAAPGHSWATVAASGSSIGHKGMLHAAKIMALAAIDCYSDPVHLQKARAEFIRSTNRQPYQCPIPDYVNPRQYENPERNKPKLIN
ncbi:MAG: amidohydrolase [Chloroflexi bacterium]|nr:amidohydrolase [Chloroflexota bacterium]